MSSQPVCGVRETFAFLRDPAGFTAGPGLRLGDFYRVRRPGPRLHVVTDPALAEQILVTEAAHFEKSRIYWGELRRSMGESMGALEGPRWEYLPAAQRPFFTPDAARTYLPAVDEQTRLALRRLTERAATRPDVALPELFADLAARIVLATLFGQEDAPASPELARRLADGHAIVAWRDKFPWRPALGWLNGMNRRARRHREWLDGYADGLRRSPAFQDPSRLLHALARIEADREAPRFSSSLVRNEIAFHLGAGTETLATAIVWTLVLLWKHRDVLERLRDEVSGVAARSPVSWAHVDSLPYTRQVVQEALRLYPPVYAILRDCTRPLELRGYAVRRGDTFLISVYGLHRNPRLWNDAERFRPERFEPHGATAVRRCQYLPFGAGRHACIGRHLALPAIALTVAHFAQQFDWECEGPDIVPVASPGLKPH